MIMASTPEVTDIGEFLRQKRSGQMLYPYEAERQLVGKVRIGDRTGAGDILESLLDAIKVQSRGDISVLKARLVELLSVLSRAAVEGGVDVDVMLGKNAGYIGDVMKSAKPRETWALVSRALYDFVESVYACQDAAKITQIAPAVDFMEAYYDQPLTLADVAKAAHLSVSRLSHLFREQTGMTIIDYLTHVRIGQARRLLLTTEKSCSKICFEVGYNNQSYFTRTFKDTVGMTPRQFRERNRRQEGSGMKELATA